MEKESSNQPGRVSAEMITAISAIFIGVCALVVSLYEAGLIREHQRAAVWPNVELGYSYNQDGLAVVIANTGIGPARIRGIAVEVEGEPINQWGEMFERLGLPAESHLVSHVSRRVLPANAEVTMLKMGPSETVDEIFRRVTSFSILACYCSVYEECWQTGLGMLPEPVVACPESEPVDL